MFNAQGQPVQTITLKDPEQIKACVNDQTKTADDLMRECVIPLLVDVRNLLTAGLSSMNNVLGMLNASLQLAEAIRQNTEAQVAKSIIGGRSGR